jgi:hypothetical protein
MGSQSKQTVRARGPAHGLLRSGYFSYRFFFLSSKEKSKKFKLKSCRSRKKRKLPLSKRRQEPCTVRSVAQSFFLIRYIFSKIVKNNINKKIVATPPVRDVPAHLVRTGRPNWASVGPFLPRVLVSAAAAAAAASLLPLHPHPPHHFTLLPTNKSIDPQPDPTQPTNRGSKP